MHPHNLIISSFVSGANKAFYQSHEIYINSMH